MTERGLVRAAEVALVGVTVAAVLGMSRLFAGGDWIAPLLANALVAHGLAAVLRRRRTAVGVAALVMTAAAGLVICWTGAWSSTTFGIPTGDTLDVLRTSFSDAWGLFQADQTPVPALTGFVVASALAIWLIAFVADWAAFRLWVPFESTLPAAVIFLFTALLGTDRGQVWGVAIYAAAVLGFLLLHRLARQEGTSHWVAERRAAGHRSLLGAGAVLAGLAVVVGAVIGPELPGADAEGLLDPRDLGDQEAPRVTISPLVDIRARLVDQRDVEVFTVRSTARAYWRLTSLERFDGRIWSSSGSYGKANGNLPESHRIEATTEAVTQSYDITNLAAIWLPSAYEPRSFSGEDVDVRYDERSSTLIVSSKVPSSDGLRYQVTSTSPRLTPEDLDGTARNLPRDVLDGYRDLPDDFSDAVRQLALDLTAEAATPYERSRALQDYLRTFTYDLSVPPGHGGDALETFLFSTKRGYCEQFAGAFAAMARAVGLPARVAVGFTPGETEPGDPTVFHVRGENAHAWPEVYFAGAGWVAFEPTPGRGMPNAEAYTGVPEQQAAAGDPSTATTVAPNQGATPTNPGTTPADDGALTPDGQDGGTGDDDRAGGGGGSQDSPLERYGVDPLRRLLPYLVGAVVLYLLVVPTALLAHRRRRRARAAGPDQRVALAWVEAMEEAELIGYRERASDTYAERARHLGAALPSAGAGAAAMAEARDRSDYAPEGAGPEEVVLATQGAAAVTAAVREVVTGWARLLRWLDPRPALRTWRQERSSSRRRIATVTSTEPDRTPVDVGAPD